MKKIYTIAIIGTGARGWYADDLTHIKGRSITEKKIDIDIG